MNTNNLYEIISDNSNINSYNRYPFQDITEAINKAKEKNLKPGEIAICYYFDHESIAGINAVIAVGNLRKGGNIIFENIKMDLFKDEVMKNIMTNYDAIKNNIDIVNYNNKIVSECKNDIQRLELKIDYANSVKKIPFVNIDLYNVDL